MKKSLLFIVLFNFINSIGNSQTLPVAQNLPYNQGFGTTTFNTFPIGIQGWNGLNGGSVNSLALAEASSPTGNATISAATASLTTGAIYGYNATSTTNAKLYVQGSSNATNGVNQICIAIKTGSSSTLNIKFDITVLNAGASGAGLGTVLQYRDSSVATWTTILGSNFLYSGAGASSNKGDADVVGDVDSFSYSIGGLTPNRTHYFRLAHWRTSGTSLGLGYDNFSFTTGCTTPSSQATSASIPFLTPTSDSLSFTRSNGDSVLIIMKSGSVASLNNTNSLGVFFPVNNNFGSGTQIGIVNYAVGKGTDNKYYVGNLTPNTTYHYAVYEYKSLDYCYLFPALTGSFTTPCSTPSTQASFNSISPGSNNAVLNFSSGTGGLGRIVVMNTVNNFTNPSNGSVPVGNSIYNSGQQVVYSGTGNTVNVTNLNIATKYYLKIFEYNCNGSSSIYNFQTTLDSVTTNLPTSSESDIIAISNSEASKISSIVNNSSPLNYNQGTKVWSFLFRDGGSDTSDIDTFDTKINSLTFLQSAGNAVDNWSDAIQSIGLFKDSVLIESGIITANQIQFSGSPLTVIKDNTAEIYTIRLTLQSTFNNTGGNLDNDDFGFSLSPSNIVLGANSSQKDPGLLSITSANDSNKIDVVATRLNFFQQPSNTGKNNVMNPTVSVEATDTFKNRDLDFNQNLVLSSNGDMSSSTIVSNCISGLAVFSNIVHNSISNSNVLKVKRSDTINWFAYSDTFKVFKTTIFKSGDIVMVGYDNNVPAGDKLILMPLVDILPGTKFCIINACYDLLNGSNIRSNKWYDSDGIGNLTDSVYSHEFIWNGSNSINAGSLLCFSVPSIGTSYTILVNGIDSTSKFSITDNGKGGSSPNMSTSNADPIFIGQGNWLYEGTHAYFNGTILFGLMTGGAWYQFSDDVSSVAQTERRSRVHPSIECLKFQGKTTSGNAFAYYNGIRTGSKRTLLANLVDSSKWISGTGNSGDDIATPFPCNNIFSITTSFKDTNYWIGQNTNWFDCNNWENFAVPDSNTNIVIRDTALNNVDIENTNSHAIKYGAIAFCKNLTVDSTKSIILNDNTDFLKIFGDLNLQSGSILNLSTTTNIGGTMNIKGNWNNNSFVDNILESGSKIVFYDTLEQSFNSNNSSGDILYNVEINKANKKILTLMNHLIASNNLVLNNGIVQTKNFILQVNGGISGYETPIDSGKYTNNKYVIGRLKRMINTNGNYFFPIGDSILGEGYNPVNLEILSGVGTATAQFIPGDPGSCAMSVPANFKCGPYTDNFVKYDDMTGEGLWSFTGSTFNYNIQAYPNYLNINTFPNESDTTIKYSSSYRLLKSPNGTTDWTPYVLSGDSCAVSYNYYALMGKGYTGFSQFAPGGGSGNSTALPIELVSFNGKYHNGWANIFWSTASERNNDYFELMASQDGQYFEPIVKVDSKGDSRDLVEYQTSVEMIKNTYFKLRQIDNDKKQGDSKIIYLTTDMENKTAKYKREGNLILIDSENLVETYLMNLTGQTIIHTNKTEIDISVLPANIYILSIKNKSGIRENYKIVR